MGRDQVGIQAQKLQLKRVCSDMKLQKCMPMISESNKSVVSPWEALCCTIRLLPQTNRLRKGWWRTQYFPLWTSINLYVFGLMVTACQICRFNLEWFILNCFSSNLKWFKVFILELKGSQTVLGYMIFFLFPLVFNISFFMTKGRFHMFELFFHSSSSSCTTLCWSLRCLYLWCHWFKFAFHLHISPCDFSSFCVILLSSSFFLLFGLFSHHHPNQNQKTETPLKQKKLQLNERPEQTKKNLHKIRPTNQNPRAHLRKSSAIAPAPPTSW